MKQGIDTKQRLLEAANELGSEQSTQDEKIRRKAIEIFARMGKYLETALRDAAREGLIPDGDQASKARELFSLIEGALLQAKVQNNLEPVAALKSTIFRYL